MEILQQNRMNEGSEESSYAQNSLLMQLNLQGISLHQEAFQGLYSSTTPKCVTVAELGWATGPNTLMLVPEIVRITYDKFRAMNKKQVPQVHVFLNDLYFNDYTTVSRSLPTFLIDLEKERNGDLGPLFISMTPGNYQDRVFPDNSLHFVHCANSAHWLTQVPNLPLSKDGESLTKGCLYITETTPPEVVRAFQQQFAKDFTAFLKSRAKEMVQSGRMVLNIMVTSKTHGPQHMWVFKFLNKVLNDMLLEGLVDEKKASEYMFHFYPPTMEEVKELVENEESFLVDKHETFNLDWDMPNEGDNKINDLKRAKFVADSARVAVEYIISSLFGDALAKEFFQRFTNLVHQHLANGSKIQTFHQIISLIKK